MIQKLLGKIIKIHGCDGAVTVKIEKYFSEKIGEMESLFLEIEGRRVPFFIKSFQTSGHENLILWFDDYDSVEKVREFIGRNVFLLTPENTNRGEEIHGDLTGYEIFTPDNIIIGTITEVAENNKQFLITAISASGREILVPLHDDLVVMVDNKLKKIVMSLPEGLITLN
jgi:16S rRNA processing protein RimM